jgi:short-subunit dehydrogenase
MKKHMTVRGSKVLITGGGSGIGLAAAASLARRGALPMLVDINRASLDKALDELKARGLEALAFAVDVTDMAGMRELRDNLDDSGLSPDILINCAGLTLIAHVSSMEHEEWERIIDVNLRGTINTVEAFLPAMLERGSGHIVNIGSIDGIIPLPGMAAYCASKFAVSGLSEVLYFDLKHCGIGVSLICPGYVNTPMANSHPVKDLPIRFRGWKTVARLLEFFSSSPQKIAVSIVEAIEHQRFLVIPGLPSRIFYHYRRLFPRLATSSGVGVARIYGRLRSKIPRRVPEAC